MRTEQGHERLDTLVPSRYHALYHFPRRSTLHRQGAEHELPQRQGPDLPWPQFSLQVAVQEVDSQPIADALDRAVRRKRPGSTTNVSVRLVAEGDYLVESKPVDPRAKVVFTVTSLLPLAPSRGKSSEAHLRHKS
jgi:hypothetical protein